MAADEYIVWVPVPCTVPMVVKATSYADARRVLLAAYENGSVAEEARQLDAYISYDGPDTDDADDWAVVGLDAYFENSF